MLTESRKNGAEQATLLPNKALQPDARYARAAELKRYVSGKSKELVAERHRAAVVRL